MIFRNSGHCESWAPSGGPTTQLTTAVRTVGHSGRCMLRGIQCAEGSAYMDCYPPLRLCTIQSWAGSHACFPSIPPSPLSFLEFLLPLFCFSVAATAVAYFTTSTQGLTGTYQNIFKQKSMSYGCWDLFPACNPSIWEIEFCDSAYALEPVCCKKRQKNSSWPVTGLWSRGPLKDPKDSNLILNESPSYSHDHLGSVWYHSEPSEGLYSPNQ